VYRRAVTQRSRFPEGTDGRRHRVALCIGDQFPSPRLSAPTLGLVLGVAVLIGGCRSLEPAPVENRELGSAPPTGYYQVKEGDTLYTIAWGLGLDYRRVAELNGIPPPYRIQAGQLIRVAEADAKPSPESGDGAGGGTTVEKVPPLVRADAGKTGEIAGAPRWQWPVSGKVVQTYRKGDRTRQGLRIAGHSGQRVLAAEAGTVVYSGSGLIGYGNLIILKHNKDYLSAYGYNRKLSVKEGDRVSRGEQIAELGQGPGAGYMLHFEIRYKGSAVDPQPLLPQK